MRSLALALALGGCGRVAFEAAPDARAARPDAAPRICPPTLTFDEDGDGYDDACDVCPHITDAQQDADGDGVGDLCDPQPATPAEYLAWFDGFNSVRPEWQTNNPLVGGQMIIDVTTASSSSVIDLAGSHWRIDVGGAILAVGPTPQQLFVSGQIATNDAYYVELIDTGGGRRRSLMHSLETSYTELDGVTEVGTPVPTGPFVLELSNVPDQLRAHVAFPSDAISMVSPGIGTIDTYRHVLYVRGLSVALDYVVVIQAR